MLILKKLIMRNTMIYFKKVFKFLSSVKLAIPIMLVILVCSVAGTILESRFNAEYAGLKIYKTGWFLLVLSILWINILCAALSRIPWKKRHVGFLITHLGMLTLLLGSVITMIWGIDGTMQIYEKSDSNLVFLQNNVIEVNGVKTPIKRYLEKINLSDTLLGSNVDFSLSTYMPFAEVPEKNFDKGVNLNFKIKSAFFDVVQVLNSELEKEIQMGPATFRLVEEGSDALSVEQPTKKLISHKGKIRLAKESSQNKNQLIIKDQKGSVVKTIKLEINKTINIGDVKFKIVRIFKNAQIASNKIEEGDEGRSNPAVELEVIKDNKSLREIVYQNIPEFSLNPNGLYGYKIAINLNSSPAVENIENNSNQMAMAPHGNADRIKNTVEFKILQNNEVEVALYKDGQQLVKKVLKEKELFVTPWMGIEITFLGTKNASDGFIPVETEPQRKMPLPPSAILLKARDGKEAWIAENSEINFNSNNKQSSVYYGRERLFLPFAISLMKFEKNDYPGSQMAMDYKSFVQINGQGPVHEIYMNEPLKLENYTFYQSSYQITPNAPAVTILSVNRDPGRALKYLGSIILCLGIIIYTLQKSKRVQNKFNI